jgi:hypothetical protein
MEKNIIHCFLALATLFLASCEKEDPKPANCSASVNLGFFVPTRTLPYDTFQYLLLTDELGDTSNGISVNHPSNLSFHHQQLETVGTYASDCEALNSVEKFTWTVHENQAVLLFGFDGHGHSLLIRETSRLDEADARSEMVGDYLEFYDQNNFSGTISGEPFMRILTEERQAGKGAQFETGYTKPVSIELAGKTYTNIYHNTADLQGAIKRYYYHRDQGVVAVMEQDGKVWRLAD